MSPPGRPKGEPFERWREGRPASGRAAAPKLALLVQTAATAADVPARATLRRWVLAALEHDAAITLRLVGGAEGRRLNRSYRGGDRATNVLTFVYTGPPRIEADIVLCLPVIRREARAARRSLRAHLAHLVIHGVLHAQGYTHDRDRAAARMQRREVELLAGLRIGDPYG